MKKSDEIRVEIDGPAGWLRINRPERLNAFSGDMRKRIEDGLAQLDAQAAVRCVIVTGVGRAFSTGGDIGIMAELIGKGDVDGFESLVRTGARIVTLIDGMSKPVIAAVNGPAAGAGACLALACDLRVASETASIGFAFLRVGLHPDWGGSYFLPRLIGLAAASEAVYTGGMIAAERAERLGIFNRVVPSAELETAVRGLAGQIAAGPAGIVADAKRSLRTAMHAPLADILEMEVAAQLRAFASPDFREGIHAFLEKRAPRFNRTKDERPA
ncbi:MAG: enoyl-CoA hydratase-related protein [Gemmatimonadetes bacterium]|nr:enoyl-CoA hydratase-related protein [Gemmatimonadota bacterium]